MIWHREPDSLVGSREGVTEALDQVIRHALAKKAEDRPADWDDFANQLSALITNNEVPRGPLQRVLDSERFTLLRSLDFFTGFGDVELWEVVHRARWQRFPLGHHIYKAGQEGGASTSSPRARWRSSATARRWPASAPAPRWANWPTWRPAPSCASIRPTWW
jgi:hypothetical protein